jgi:hypothetical protein
MADLSKESQAIKGVIITTLPVENLDADVSEGRRAVATMRDVAINHKFTPKSFAG